MLYATIYDYELPISLSTLFYTLIKLLLQQRRQMIFIVIKQFLAILDWKHLFCSKYKLILIQHQIVYLAQITMLESDRNTSCVLN